MRHRQVNKSFRLTIRNATQKQVVDWVRRQLPAVSHMVTLTLKQHMQLGASASRINPCGYKAYHELDETLAAKACEHFMERLNSAIFRSAARRYGMSLLYIPALEVDVNDRLHLHIGIGAVPAWALPQLDAMYRRAARLTDWVDEQIDIVEADDDGIVYITKQVENHNTSAILWQCVPVTAKLHQPTITNAV